VPPLSDRGGELVEGDRQAPVHRRLDRQLVGPRRRFCTKAWPAITTLALWSCCKPRIGRSRDFRRPWSASTRLLASCSRFDATVPPAAPPARSVGRCTVGDHLNGCDPCGTDHALEEPSGCPDVAPRGDEHVDDLAELIDRSVHLPPLAGDLHLRLIHEPAISHRMPTWPGRLGQLRRAPLHPPVDGDVVDLDPALGEQRLDVAGRQAEAQIPTDREDMMSGGKRKPAKADRVVRAGRGRRVLIPAVSMVRHGHARSNSTRGRRLSPGLRHGFAPDCVTLAEPGRALNPHGDQSTRGSQRVVAKVQCSTEA
jgi:hypothetical protein